MTDDETRQANALASMYLGMRFERDRLEVENARLRDLVKDVQRFHECGRDCTECPLFDQCHEGNLTNGCIGNAIIHDRMRALGIEVE